EAVHHLKHRPPLERIRDGRALKHISRGEEDDAPGIAGLFRFYHCRQVRVAAPRLRAAGRCVTHWKDPAMKVVYVEYRQSFCGLGRQEGAVESGNDRKEK